MAALYYAPCIVYGSTRFYLPPWVKVRVSRRQQVDFVSIPNTDSAVISSIRKNQGSRISLTVSDASIVSTEDVLTWFEDLWANLSGREFKLFIFSDRAWTGCALESQDEEIGLEPLTYLRDTGISIICTSSAPDTTQQLTFSPDYATAYPYASIVGRPAGEAVDPGEGVTPVGEPAIQILSALFPGVVEAITSSGHEFRVTVGGTAGSQWRIKGLQITSAEIVGSATTTVRLSTAAIGGSGSNLDATVGASALFGSEATPGGNIDVTAGDTLYLFIPTGGAGGHQNVQCRFRLEAL